MSKKIRTQDKPYLKINNIEDADNALKNWEKWIKIRKNETEHLSSATNRPPVDLTMNLLEHVREDKERKLALEHAKIDAKPAIRGGLWEQPLHLKQKCWYDPIYQVKRTAAEKGKPRVIEHIGVPKIIQETEKGASGEPERNVCYQLNADFAQYREKRELDLSKKLKKIDPFRPIIDELIVQGRKPKPPQKKMPSPPLLTFNEIIVPPEITDVYAVRINNSVFFKNSSEHTNKVFENMKKQSWHENCLSWKYYLKSQQKRACRCKLYLENLGTVTLRFCWKKIKQNIPFIPEDALDQVFFFNKNEGVLAPSQKKVILFTFISDKFGIFNEVWELSFCNICFFETLADKFVVHLNADAIEDINSENEKVYALKNSIYSKVISNIVMSILNEILDMATTVKPQIYPYKELFLEAEMFIMKNPVCFYHQTELSRLKDLYAEMDPGHTWDLSIESWRQKMMEQDYNNRVKYYDHLKKSFNDLLKPWYEREDVLNQKYRVVKWLFGELAERMDKEYDRNLVLASSLNQLNKRNDQLNESNGLTPKLDLNLSQTSEVRNLFYLYVYEHLSATIEMCAGVISSIDLNRWIEFNFDI
ncbi:hypothetical protein ACJJTC_012374 [Scirpophaga incertulas]